MNVHVLFATPLLLSLSALAAPRLVVPRLLSRGDNKVARDLLAVLADGPKRPAELRRELGVASPNYFTSCYLTPLAAAGFIVAEGSPHSPQRTYRLTAKGRRALA